MNNRTDLALEAFEAASVSAPEGIMDGIVKRESNRHGMKVTRITIETEEGSRRIGRPQGNYITVDIPSFSDSALDAPEEIVVLAEEISSLLPKDGTVMVAGLGNSQITPDSLGPEVTKKIFATRHIDTNLIAGSGFHGLRSVCCISVGVLGQTGIESGDIIKELADSVDAACVIVVDALAAGHPGRLGKTVQISDTGISPGSGVQNKRKEISSATLSGTKVISIGIPTVVDASLLGGEKAGAKKSALEMMMVTPKEIDVIIQRAAKTVALSINSALFPSLSVEDLDNLTS